jgi:polysaccharide export outer membrane protein
MKTKGIYLFSIIGAMLLLLDSCSAYKKLPYLTNVEGYDRSEQLAGVGVHDAKIMPNDILSITVNSTASPAAAADFNLPLVSTNSNQAVPTATMSVTGTTGSLQNYLVDRDGTIDFPTLGRLEVAGKTTKELQEYLISLIYPKYISKEAPIVNVRFLNFKVSVLGEVARPGSYQSENGQMTILDALAAAGDMTIYGKRNNVLLIRTYDDGRVDAYRVNLQDKKLFSDKNIFYLQQNDKLYVETNKARGNSSQFGTMESMGLSALSVLISIIAIVTR